MKFNIHTDITPKEIADRVSNGDIWQAEYLAFQLMIFLESIAVNPEAIKAIQSFNIPWIGSDNARLIVETLRREKSKEKGKSTKSGAELFAKFMVPNKPTKKQAESLYLAYLYDSHKQGNSKRELERVCESINVQIEINNDVRRHWDDGIFDNRGYNQHLPKRLITKDELDRAYRTHKTTIEKKNDIANGVTRNLIKK